MAGTDNNTIEAAEAAAAQGLKDAVALYEAEETRLSSELASVVAKRKAASKALESLGQAPKRRRGRPRKTDAERAAEAAAASAS